MSHAFAPGRTRGVWLSAAVRCRLAASAPEIRYDECMSNPPPDAQDKSDAASSDTEVSSAPSAGLAQPTGSSIVLAASGDALTFIVPRTGIRGTALALLIVALFWNGFTAFAVAMLLSQAAAFSGSNVLFLFFMIPFIAVGVFMFILFLQSAYRKVVIVATPQALVIEQKAPVKNREYQWASADLCEIATDYSGTQINDRRLRELRIYFASGAHKGFFDGRDDAELAWLAQSLKAFYPALPGLRRTSDADT
jgi:hypothetical protein